MRKLLFIFGTRPEAVKMAPVISECRKYPESLEVKVCLTGQHREMLDQVLRFFDISGDFDLALMQPDQTLFDITAKGLIALEKVLTAYGPDMVLVQGDTTSAFIGALAAFYKKIKVVHIEAGLRSNSRYSPFPEEINRKLIGSLSDVHFTPTQKATENLAAENTAGAVYQVGNTVIDALLYGVDKVRRTGSPDARFGFLDPGKRTILVTGHRRESFGKPFEEVCDALVALAGEYPDIQIVYPVHLNPHIREVVHSRMKDVSSIFLIPPVEYPEMLWLLDRCYFVITDSGGVQEEAPSLGKPVLVIRDVTERGEGIAAGTACLVGTDKGRILLHARLLLDNKTEYDRMARAVNPYGDGAASARIFRILQGLRLEENCL
jgi:UDP-N-acetylglucosamine 2-epimerase (non-hydrolysing)